MLNQSAAFFARRSSGQLMSRITNDVSLVRGAIANGFAQAIRQTLLVAAYLIAVLSANWKLFLLTLVVAPPSFYLIGNIGRRLRRYSTRSQEKMGDLTGALQETITGVRVIKSFNLEAVMGERFRRLNQAYTNAMVRMTRTGSLAPPVTEILGATVGVVILYIGGRDIVHGTGMDAGRFLMFLIALFALMQPIRTLSQVNIQIQEGLAAAARIFQVLDTESTLAEKPDAATMPREIREIRFEDVSFSYVDGKPVLVGVDFVAPAGSMIAIVGPSGAGKTTLVDMIPRFYDPQRGRVLVNGIDLRDLSVAGLRGAIGLVTQETVLFDDSVEANIALGRPGATRAEIEEAARAANADGFIRDAGGVRDANRRPRGQAIRGPAPAARDRPRDPQEPAGPHLRRSDLRSTARARRWCRRRSTLCATAPPSSSPTGCRPCGAPTGSSCSSVAASSSRVATTSCWRARAAPMRSCTRCSSWPAAGPRSRRRGTCSSSPSTRFARSGLSRAESRDSCQLVADSRQRTAGSRQRIPCILSSVFYLLSST